MQVSKGIMLLRSLRNIIIFFCAFAFFSHILHLSGVLFSLYERPLGGIPSHRFVSQLMEFKNRCSNKGALIIGPSTVREGLDDENLSNLTGLCSVNAGVTSDGSIYHTAVQLDIPLNLSVNADLVILGINSRMMSDRRNPIVYNRYIDFLNYRQVQFYKRFDNVVSPGRIEFLAIRNALFPLLRHTLRANYLVRNTLLTTRVWLEDKKSISDEKTVHIDEQFMPSPKYLYSDTVFNKQAFDRQMKGTETIGMLDSRNYAWDDHRDGLERVIESASRVANKVYILVMPEHSEVRNSFGSFADADFYEIIRRYESDEVVLLDAKSLLEDNFFRDTAHLLPQGRGRLTAYVASQIVKGI